MTQLLLVKHALPEIDPGIPASQWRLSSEGRRRCLPLAEQLAVCRPQALACSLEPKAMETAQIISEHLSLSLTPTTGLHEHQRPAAPVFNQADFEAAITRFFAHPDDLIYGTETAVQARQRFSIAIAGLLTRYPDRTLAVVTHGTVITLFVAHYNAIDPFVFWKSLALPSFVVLSIPTLALESVYSPSPIP